MKLAAELALALAAGLLANRVASCDRAERATSSTTTEVTRRAAVVDVAAPRTAQPRGIRGDTPKRSDDNRELRNAAIVAASKWMADRGASLESCFGSTPIVDALKLRFAVDVSSNPSGGTVHAWRFVEVVSGQETPATFASCAAETLGRDQPMLPQDGQPLPTFDCELTIIYTVDRKPMEAGDPSLQK